MFAGFDYGTSNCALGVMENNAPKLLNLGQHGRYMSSTLYSPSREIIVDWLAQHIPDAEEKNHFLKLRGASLQKAKLARNELLLDGYDDQIYFGRQALDTYLEEPEEGYYVKSPKSFLGASGLNQAQLALFEDIVGAMMRHIKICGEQSLGQEITQTVIGRPVNFQGLRGEESNTQALQLLTKAAKRAGYKQIEFQFEPIAAGFDFEAGLNQERTVLVVDIGGGTTDCSVLKMGPQYRNHTDRQQDVLGHTGERVGGNDFDIHFALRSLMPNLGLDSMLVTGKPVPVKPYWDAVAINDVGAQTRFYGLATQRQLKELIMDAANPERVSRLLRLQQHKQSYQLVNAAEQGKIALSEAEEIYTSLNFLETGLGQQVSQADFASANNPQLENIRKLMQEALNQAQCRPDVVYVTGGTAKSPVIKQFLQQEFNQVEIVVGDHFGSVASGLTRWAELCFR